MNRQDSADVDLDRGLQALKESIEDASAPQRVETALLAAFRERAWVGQRRAPRLWLGWSLAAGVAAVVLLAIAAGLLREKPAPASPPVAVAEIPEPPAVMVEEAPKAMPAPAKRAVRRAPVQQAATEEIVTDFIPVVHPAMWQPGESGQILRVRVPRSSLASFGLPMNANLASESVRADVIVGYDGVVRAIRFVR